MRTGPVPRVLGVSPNPEMQTYVMVSTTVGLQVLGVLGRLFAQVVGMRA